MVLIFDAYAENLTLTIVLRGFDEILSFQRLTGIYDLNHSYRPQTFSELNSTVSLRYIICRTSRTYLFRSLLIG